MFNWAGLLRLRRSITDWSEPIVEDASCSWIQWLFIYGWIPFSASSVRVISNVKYSYLPGWIGLYYFNWFILQYQYPTIEKPWKNCTYFPSHLRIISNVYPQPPNWDADSGRTATKRTWQALSVSYCQMSPLSTDMISKCSNRPNVTGGNLDATSKSHLILVVLELNVCYCICQSKPHFNEATACHSAWYEWICYCFG